MVKRSLLISSGLKERSEREDLNEYKNVRATQLAPIQRVRACVRVQENWDRSGFPAPKIEIEVVPLFPVRSFAFINPSPKTCHEFYQVLYGTTVFTSSERLHPLNFEMRTIWVEELFPISCRVFRNWGKVGNRGMHEFHSIHCSVGYGDS